VTVGIFGTLGLAVCFGFVLGRWWAPVLAGLAWPVCAVAVAQGWWGNRFSHEDPSWLIVALIAVLTLVALFGATLGVLARKGVSCGGVRARRR
jgi:hypothetical protein